MIRNLLILVYCISSFTTNAQELKTYQIYSGEGQKVSFHKMIDSLSTYDVVLFGEFHDHPVIHWLQLKTTEALYAENQNLVLGAEMFETDNQLILNEYLQNRIPENRFEEEMRLWDNYQTDYKPLVNFAKNHKLSFIATNVPRRYATAVATWGLDTLKTFTKQAKSYFAKLPIEVDTLTPGYGEMLGMMSGHGMKAKAMNFVAAQAIKDATMAEKIRENLPKKGVFLHYNGDYHSKDYGGIYWYLNKKKPKLKVAVISVEQANDRELKYTSPKQKPGDFIIVVPQDFTKSF